MLELRLIIEDNNNARAAFTARALSFPANDIAYISSAMGVVAPLTDGAIVGARLYWIDSGVPYGVEQGTMVPALYMFYDATNQLWQYINGQLSSSYAYDNIMYREDIEPDVVQLADNLVSYVYGDTYRLQVIATDIALW